MFCCDFSLKTHENQWKLMIFELFQRKITTKHVEKIVKKWKPKIFIYFFCHWNLHKDALYRNLGATESGKYSKPRDFFFYRCSKIEHPPNWWLGWLGWPGLWWICSERNTREIVMKFQKICDFLRNFSTFVVYTVNLC